MLTIAAGTNYQVDLLLKDGNHPMDGFLFAAGANRICFVAH